MSRTFCIFDDKKLCNNCGECDLCDLTPDKKCNNCGKCLEMEGYDMRAIKIDSILEDNDPEEPISKVGSHLSNEFSNDEHDKNSSDVFDKYSVQYIEDIDGLSEILENENNFKKLAHEEYPGFIKIQKKPGNDRNQSE
ncbi:MAG: hypothetical protein LKE46_06160 [Clostridium sp.]|jgi:hypothetical protein|uniref:hypothetical protein n=1 Tax=Clostridium sp. TaxID=1506 RepID=UPI0025BD084E|nr:hypothetical protein [Clostridium sp.]MCH3963840.1 hypothetical protein [Clostridium sp.]MCI1716959.1 hypothetical protein [Clostridium sp.]MCI1801322.1 hypothetical protein [Clostridium sp.]MCI1815168.1 hypothetical protein [Clostridium sp.]MCI1872048.1 hypothetical protein [Clostridium sp.]